MKTIYRCEVCGKEYGNVEGENWETAFEHEKECRNEHAAGIRLAEQFNDTVKETDERGIEVGVGFGGDNNIYRFIGAEYNVKERIVMLEIDTEDNIAKRNGGAIND